MERTMIIKEIAKRFDGEWVIVADPKYDRHRRFKSGRVLVHSPDRNEAYRRLLSIKPRPRSIASLSFLKLRDDEVIVV